MLIQNLVVRRQTLNTPHEVIDSVFKRGNHSFYKLGCQNTNLIFDLCAEPYGLNRMSDDDKESILDYIRRMLRNDNLYTREDYSLHEFIPSNMQKFNDMIKTQDHTYYFSIASSIRGKRVIKKSKDVLHEPAKSSHLAASFDLAIDKNLRSYGHTSKACLKDKRSELSWMGYLTMCMKYWSNPLNVLHTLSWDNFMEFTPHRDSLNNLLNPKMNNYDAIDYKNKEWTHDHDCLIPKYSQEFPRESTQF